MPLLFNFPRNSRHVLKSETAKRNKTSENYAKKFQPSYSSRCYYSLLLIYLAGNFSYLSIAIAKQKNNNTCMGSLLCFFLFSMSVAILLLPKEEILIIF